MPNINKKTELQKAFEESGFKYQELADELGISKSYCYKVINYNNYGLRVYYDLAVKLSEVFGKEVSVLFKEQENFFNKIVS